MQPSGYHHVKVDGRLREPLQERRHSALETAKNNFWFSPVSVRHTQGAAAVNCF